MEVGREGGRGGSGGRVRAGRVVTSRLHWFIAGTGDGARRQRCERGGCAWCWIHIAMLVHATDFCWWAGVSQAQWRWGTGQAAPRGTKIDTKSSRNPLMYWSKWRRRGLQSQTCHNTKNISPWTVIFLDAKYYNTNLYIPTCRCISGVLYGMNAKRLIPSSRF